MDYGLWTTDYGLWTMDYGLWTMTKRNTQGLVKLLASGRSEIASPGGSAAVTFARARMLRFLNYNYPREKNDLFKKSTFHVT